MSRFPIVARSFRPASLLLAAAVTLAPRAEALTDLWVGNASVNWNALNWSGGNNPPLAGDLVTFGVAGTAGAILNNDLAALFAINGITFNAGASAYTFAGNAITLAGPVTNNSTSRETINFNIDMAAQRTFTTVAGGGNLSFGGVLSGAGGLATAGVGTVFLTNTANTTNGELIIGNAPANTGTVSTIVNVASLSDYGVASSIGARTLGQENNAPGGISLHFRGGILQYTGSTPQSTNREIRILNGTAGATIDASGSNPAATLSFTHTGANINLFDTSGTRTLNLTGTNTGANTFAIKLENQAASATSFNKAGTGTWFLTSDLSNFTGLTQISGGVLNVSSVSDYGVPSAIGARTLAVETAAGNGIGLWFGPGSATGTLQYTGSTPQSTNRNIRVGIGGATLDASGSNPAATLSFTKTGANTNLFDTAGTRTITLTGTNTGDNGFSIELLNQAGSPTSLTKNGTGTWLLNGPGAMNNSGTTSVNNGILKLGKTAAISVNGPLTIGNGVTAAVVALASTGSGGNQIADATVPTFNGTGATAGILRMNNLAETVGGLNSSGGAGVVENESGTAGTGTLTVNVTGVQSFAGTLRNGDGVGTDGVLAFTKTGSGTQILSGAHTHTGATTINGGTLTVDGSIAAGSAVVVGNTGTLNGIGTINGAVTIGNGGTVSGAGTFSGAVSVASGGTLSGDGTFTGTVGTVGGSRISPGSAFTAGTLTLATLTLTTGALVDLEFGGGNDAINITSAGGLALNGGGFNLFNTGLGTPLTTNGSYTLLDYTTSFTGALANLSIANAQTGKFYSLANDTGTTRIVLTIGDATVSEWNGATANGLWTTAGNWTPSVPNTAGTVARFGAPGAPTAVAVDGAKTVGGILFDSAGSYTISGGATDTITLNNGIAAAGLGVANGTHTLAAPLLLATDALASTAAGTTLTITGNISGAKGFTASGLGTTILTGTNSFTTTSVTNGTLQIGMNSTTGSLGSGDVTVAAGGTLVFSRSDDFTVANNISGAGAQITKLGAGTLTLTGANAFSTANGSGLNLNAGTVKLGSASALATGIVLALNGGTLDLNTSNLATSSLTGATGTITDSGAAGTTLVTIDQSTVTTFGASLNNGPTRALAVTKNGVGALTLTGHNTFSGGLTITNGAVLAAGTGGSVPIASSVTLGDGSNDVWLIAGVAGQQFGSSTAVAFTDAAKNAKLLLRGTNQTLAGVDSALNFTTSLSIIQNDEVAAPGYTGAPGLATLTLDTATDHSFTGLIRNQVGGGMNLVKEGVGTQEIKNVLVQADNFGTLTVNNGKFAINFTPNASGTNTLGTGTSVILGTNGTLVLDGNWTMNRVISGTGQVLKQGTLGITVNAVNSYTGLTTIAQGSLTASAAGTSLPGNVTVGTGVQNGVFLIMGAANQFGVSSVLNFNNGTGNDAKFELRGFPQTIAGLSSDADDTLSIVQNQETGAPASTTLTISNSSDYIFNGIIRTQLGGALNLVKNGAGTQEIRNVPAQANNFGTLVIDEGKFTVNLTGSTNTLGAGTAVTVNSLGTLGLDGTWNMNRSITGAGKVLKQGTGDVTISGAQTYAQLQTTGGTTTLTSSLPGATITNTAGTLNIDADAAGSTVNVSAVTHFGTAQTLAGLNIANGGVVTFGAAPSAPSAIGATSAFGSQNVPEPGALGLLVIGTLGLLGRRPARRRK